MCHFEAGDPIKAAHGSHGITYKCNFVLVGHDGSVVAA
jgi:hypothetical protein